MPETSDARTIDVGQEFMADFKVEVLTAEKSDDGTRGKVTALVSAYNKPYRMGFATYHHIEDGAFASSLAENANVPLFWQHNWAFSEQPPIGHAVGSEESKGLVIKGEFYLDTEAGRSVFNAMKAGAIREWSIGYRITRYEVEESDDDTKDTVFVKEADLMEASAVLRGANPHTETLKVASENDVLHALADLTSTVAEVIKTQGMIVTTLTQHESQVSTLLSNALPSDQAVDQTTQVEASLGALAGQFVPAIDKADDNVRCVEDGCENEATATRPVSEDVTEWVCDEHAQADEVETAKCWFLGCDEDGAHDVAGDIKACDEHKVAGRKGVPQPPAASPGEEAQVEPTVEGGELEPEAASGPALRVPDFLPPSDPDDNVDTDDVVAQTRVMRAWQRAKDDAEIRQLTPR